MLGVFSVNVNDNAQGIIDDIAILWVKKFSIVQPFVVTPTLIGLGKGFNKLEISSIFWA